MTARLSQRILGSRFNPDETVGEALFRLREAPDSQPHIGDHRDHDDRVIVARVDDTVAAAHRLFRRFDLHHLPIVSDTPGQLAGIVSATDLLEFFALSPMKDPESVPLSEVMTRDPAVIGKEAPLREAVSKLTHSQFRCLPVLNPAGELSDIITTRDLVRLIDLALS